MDWVDSVSVFAKLLSRIRHAGLLSKEVLTLMQSDRTGCDPRGTDGSQNAQVGQIGIRWIIRVCTESCPGPIGSGRFFFARAGQQMGQTSVDGCDEGTGVDIQNRRFKPVFKDSDADAAGRPRSVACN